MYSMKYVYTTLTLLILSVPFLAEAHVKWFAESNEIIRPYQITDIPVVFSVLLGICIILCGVYANRVFSVPLWYKKYIEKYAAHILSVASIGFGISFIIFSHLGFIFAPNLPAEGETGALLLIVQFIAGLMIFLGLYERVGGILLVLLFILASREYGFTEMMDTFEMLGFALYAIIIGRPLWKISDSTLISHVTHSFHMYGVPLLRVGTGINLIVLGLSEKILAPSLTHAFLQEYQWNFMTHLGFSWFTDYWFAYSAGFVEMLFGVFLVLGLVTRTTILALAVFLVTTLVLLGPVELIGHLPHFSIALVLLVFGASSVLHIKNKEDRV